MSAGAVRDSESDGGVYVIYRDDAEVPAYLDRSPAGTFRGDPSVNRESLEANWVPGAQVLYIGKANHGRLRKRLGEFIDFGRGGKNGIGAVGSSGSSTYQRNCS
jgi:hypothetical protein